MDVFSNNAVRNDDARYRSDANVRHTATAQIPWLCNTGLTLASPLPIRCTTSVPVTPVNPQSGGSSVDGNWQLATPYPSAAYTHQAPNPCFLLARFLMLLFAVFIVADRCRTELEERSTSTRLPRVRPRRRGREAGCLRRWGSASAGCRYGSPENRSLSNRLRTDVCRIAASHGK
jgi:hypothetical protein